MKPLILRMIALLQLVLLISTGAGCSSADDDYGVDPSDHHKNRNVADIKITRKFNADRKIRIVCTTAMVADLARNIGGDRVEVVQLMGAGVDPHLYKASPADTRELTRADVIFYSGLHLEGKMTEAFESLRHEKLTFAVAEYLKAGDSIEESDGKHDPHVWFDVSLWMESAKVVQKVLLEYDPQHADQYKERGIRYLDQLGELHRYAKEQLSQIPAPRRVLITAHDAFRYFGRAYHLDVRGIQGISTESEAGVREVNELVEFIVSRKIKALFVESSVSDKNIRALIEGCRARGHTVTIGGELFSDAMDQPGTPAGTYIGMVRHNVDTIVKALK